MLLLLLPLLPLEHGAAPADLANSHLSLMAASPCPAPADTCSNSIRVIKTTKQTATSPLSYPDAVKVGSAGAAVWGCAVRGRCSPLLSHIQMPLPIAGPPSAPAAQALTTLCLPVCPVRAVPRCLRRWWLRRTA